MVEFVTDRTRANVNLLNRLCKKPWSEMSASEKEAWYGDAAKGAYNYTDLNRVESAVAKISTNLGLGLVTKTDWTVWDVPTQEDMARYIWNVARIRQMYEHLPNLPVIPVSMNNLSYMGANNIEVVLKMAYEDIEATSAVLGKGKLGKMVMGKELL
jgi:hypothetical protein